MSALLNNNQQFSLFTIHQEAELFHSPERHGFFSILQSVHGTRRQRSYKLVEMPKVLDYLDKTRDSWMSQAEFFKPNRRVVNLWRVGLLFVDIDSYNVPQLRDAKPDYLVSQLLFYCDELGVPFPSVVIHSGRGLQAKWLLDKPLPRAALPRWNACQRVLVERLSEIGADHQAKDASRVLRLVQTANSKSGTLCYVAHVTEENGHPIRYDFEFLAEELLPYTREEIAQMRAQRQAEWELRQSRGDFRILEGGKEGGLKGFSGRQLAWHRLEDLRKLAELRGGYVEGERMLHLHWQTNFLVLSGATNSNQMWHEAAALSRAIDANWGYHAGELSTLYRKAKEYEAGVSIEFNGKRYPALYTPRNDTLINLFKITDDEQRQLRTIISRDIARERHAERDTVRRRAAGGVTKEEYNATRAAEMQQRVKQASELRSKGMSYRAIAHKMGVSVASIHKYLNQN